MLSVLPERRGVILRKVGIRSAGGGRKSKWPIISAVKPPQKKKLG